MGRYSQSGSMGVWASGPPGIRAVENGLWAVIVTVDPRVFGPLGLLENGLQRVGVQVDMVRVAPRVFGPLGLLENGLRRVRWVDMVRMAPRVFGPLGLLENGLRRVGCG